MVPIAKAVRIPTGAPGFVLRAAFFGLLAAALLAPVAAAVTSVAEAGAESLVSSLPDGTSLTGPMPQRSTVLAADGSELATFFRQDRLDVDIEAVAPVLIDAVLAVEDAGFYDHGAFDAAAIVRAVTANAAAGGITEGGSTLTQQYVKQALVLSADTEAEQAAATEPTMDRKLRELGYAIAVEDALSKDEILTRYLNIVYFGNSAYGIEVAAQRYFSTPAADLILPQAALLAGLIKAPNGFDPVADPAVAIQRRGIVLERMVDAGKIDAQTARETRILPLGLELTAPRNGCAQAIHPYYCGYVLAELQTMGSLGPDPDTRVARLHDGGLTVRTTLDPGTQRAAQRSVHKHIGRGHPVGTAIVMTEPGTGAVRAIALNRRWGEGKGETTVNYALDKAQGGSSGFQAGSAFKPFVLAAALDKGLDPSLRLPAYRSATADDIENCTTGKTFPPYTVGNYGEQSYFGFLDMADATAMSVNTYFLALEERTGICAPARIAGSMGLARANGEDLTRVPSFVLGVDEVSPLRMAEAYATFAAGGVHCDSFALTSVSGPDDVELELPERDCQRALDKAVARDVTKLLRGVIDGDNPRRTGAQMEIGRAAAGKTGTTNKAVAVWFAGYTDDLAAVVWAGYPGKSKPLRNITLRGTAYEQLFGGALPGPIWRDAMKAALGSPKQNDSED